MSNFRRHAYGVVRMGFVAAELLLFLWMADVRQGAIAVKLNSWEKWFER